MHSDDPTRADRERERRRQAERRRRRREEAGDAVEDGGQVVDGVGDIADLATGGTPTPGLGGGRGGGRGGGWCDNFGGGGGGRGGGGGGCDGCDCNLNLLQVVLLAVLVGPASGRRGTIPAWLRAAPVTRGPRLSTVLLVAAAVLPDRAGPAVAAAIRLYRRRLTRFTPACPDSPSCSAYALAAVADLGARRGLRLAATRLGGCAPTR